MVLNTDYVISQKANFILNKGVFIGTKSYLFIFPFEEYNRKIEKTRMPFAQGKSLEEIVMRELSKPTTTENDFYSIISSLKHDLLETEIYVIDEFKQFKVNSNILGSGIVVKKKGAKNTTSLSWGLGRNYRKQIKLFYKNN